MFGDTIFKAKNTIDLKVKKFYQQMLFRKLRLRNKIYRRKSEDKFINRFKRTFRNPSDVVFCIGDWGKGKQTMMRGSSSTLGSGINKIISRHFPTLLNDEYNTSKKCCNCGCDVENLYMPIKNKETGKIENKKIHRLMRCNNCIKIAQKKLDDLRRSELLSMTKSRVSKSKLNTTRSESRKTVVFNGGYLTRDKNSCINMMNIVKSWIYTKTRPTEYQRTKFEKPKGGLKKKSSAPPLPSGTEDTSGQMQEDKLIL